MILAVALGAVICLHIFFLAAMPHRVRSMSIGLALTLLSVLWTPSAPAEWREVALWSSTLLIFLAVLAKRTSTQSVGSIAALTIALFGVALVSTLVGNPDGLPALFRIASLAIVTTIAAGQMSASDRSAALNWVVICAVVQLGAGVWQLASGEPPLWGFGLQSDGSEVRYANPLLEGATRIQGTVGHPIPYSSLLALALVVVVTTRSARRSGIATILLIGFSGGLLFAGTRSALIAVVVSLTYVFLIARSSPHRARNYMLAAMIAVLTFAADFGIREATDELLESGSFTNRLGALQSVPGLLARPLGEAMFGSGVGSEARLFAAGALQQNGFNVIDNQAVTTLATQGVLGLIILLAIFLTSFRRGDVIVRSLVIVLFVMLFSFDYLRWPAMVVVAFLVFGMPSATNALNDSQYQIRSTLRSRASRFSRV